MTKNKMDRRKKRRIKKRVKREGKGHAREEKQAAIDVWG